MASDFLVRRDDIRECRVADAPEPAIEPGRAVLRVERFGLTANNITYALMGERMSYWDFFPAPDGWGRVPMWGFAEVVESDSDGVEPGSRVYGYLPPSSFLVVSPAGVDDEGFVDASPHREALPSAYHRYLYTASDPFYSADTEELQMLLRPLFFTSFLVDDQVADEGLVEKGPILLASASSKTAIAAAFMLAQRPGADLVGLTSERNREFVEGLGIYGRTMTYDEIDSLERSPSTFLDFAGNWDVREAVHSHLGDELVRSIVIGITHWEGFEDGARELDGPTPAFFFAPDRVVQRNREWGRAELQDRVATAWHTFAEWSAGWLETLPGDGFDAVERAYLEVLEGDVAPSTAHIIEI